MDTRNYEIMPQEEMLRRIKEEPGSEKHYVTGPIEALKKIQRDFGFRGRMKRNKEARAEKRRAVAKQTRKRNR